MLREHFRRFADPDNLTKAHGMRVEPINKALL
jgi:hypothetical protein